jgi:hypothetical protein
MKPTIKPGGQNTYHRDGSVSYWDVYAQSWYRMSARAIDDRVLASMTDIERLRIRRLAGL